MLAYVWFVVLLATVIYGAVRPLQSHGEDPPAGTTVTVEATYRGVSASGWARRFRHRTRQLQSARADVRRAWHPTVVYALRLASAVFKVPYSELSSVSACESHHYPFATNGRYKGLFQLGWVPFGLFSPFDPVANALSAAATVVHDGSWRQWECKP